jgi:hypothetical protein
MVWWDVTDSTRILLAPMQITCVGAGIGSLSSGSLIQWISAPFVSTNVKTRATYDSSGK